MAVRKESSGSANRAWVTALTLVALFAIALFLRAYWNLDAATEGGTFVLSGGSDPYYHKRAVDAIQERGFNTLVDDPLLNYPYGAVNPNPPLFEWTMASAGLFLEPMFDGDLSTSTWYATLWTAPIFGALTVFPLYFIGRALFDSRRVGILAALLWTVSTSAIDAAGIGAADHDATIMFFATLAFLFYIQTIRQFRGDGNWVTSWRNGGAIGRGLSALLRERRLGFGYALLTGISIAAVALTWKGFPYVIGIIGIYAALQLVLDHWKNRDSTGLFLGTLVALVVGIVLAYPYYSLTGTTNFVTPAWYALAAFVVWGYVLVPTRDLPTILVIPGAIAALGALIVGAFVVFPTVARSLLYATLYLKRTALYETIAEAHPASFSDLAFGIGPVLFLLGVGGWFVLLFTQRKHATRPILFALVWAAIAFYFATSAIRFLFNAIPVFAVFSAWAVIAIVDKLDFGGIGRNLAANPGWGGLRKGVRPMHIVTVILAVLLLVIPTTLLAADAAIPRESESKIAQETDSPFVKNFMEKRLGGYGQGFIEDYWHDGLTWLDQYDSAIVDPADRPAFLAWWDYGHWAIAIGRHPAVADNFQNGYEFAANFILSQNETHAVQLLSARLAPLLPQATVEKHMTAVGIVDAPAAYAQLIKWEFVQEMDLSESVAFLQLIEADTGKSIRYFAVDVRMMPLDDPQTPSLDYGSSIFYAPVKLKGDSPDDYVPVKINTGSGRFLTQAEFEDEIRRNPTRQTSASAERLEFTEKFYNSMFYRSYVGTPAQGPFPTTGDQVIQALNSQRPAIGMEHFRLIYATPALKIIEYTPGATVTGIVTEAGAPLEGVAVTTLDDSGKILLENLFTQAQGQISASDLDIPHSSVTTDATGAYSLIAPFSMEGGNITLVATKDGVELARSSLVITHADIAASKTFTLDLSVARGSVAGLVFEDKDGDGAYNESLDAIVASADITIGGTTVTTDAEGKYTVDDLSAGTQNVTIDSDTYDVGIRSNRVRVSPGETVTHDIALDLKPGTVTGLVYADVNEDGVFDAGEGAGFTLVDFAPDTTVEANAATPVRETTDSSGNFTASVKAGAYVVTVAYTAPDGTAYSGTANVAVGSGATETLTLRLTKTAA